MKEYSDQEIIDCLRKRQGYVVHYLSANYLPMINHMVAQLGGTHEDAKDIFQEGLMIMLEKIDDQKFSLTCKFKTLLYCICENLWKMTVRKRKNAEVYLVRENPEEEDKDVSDIIDEKLCYQLFTTVFETLEPSKKNILKLYWDEKSPKEIAEKLGYTYGYVRKLKCEAQGELTKKVKSHPDYLKIINSGKI